MGWGLFIAEAINENEEEREPRVQTNKGAEREQFEERVKFKRKGREGMSVKECRSIELNVITKSLRV